MNLFDLPNELALSGELTDILVAAGNVRIERIISTGQTSDWYDQTEAEFVAVIQGTAIIEYANEETVTLKRGDTLLIPPHQKHRVTYTSTTPPCVWLCVFYSA